MIGVESWNRSALSWAEWAWQASFGSLAEIAPRVMGESRSSAPERVVVDPSGPAALPCGPVVPGAASGAPARAVARPTPIAWVLLAWALTAIAEARDAGIELEPVREGRLSWIDEMTDPKTGRTGYDRKGSPISRLATKAELFPVEYSEMLTAMAITARMRLGEEPAESNAIQQGALLVTGTAPQWSPDRGTIDYYHWLFGTEAMKALGGYQWDHWRAALLEATLPHQSEDGSWPAIDAWS